MFVVFLFKSIFSLELSEVEPNLSESKAVSEIVPYPGYSALYRVLAIL